jgi:Glycosidases
MIDQVLSHTSIEHAWFKESRESRDNPKADWYVWADAKDDGSAPNNWLSLFGGSAWQWEPRRGQYYLHNFLTSQPDLNFHIRVRAAILDSVRFWLDKGVDGVRLDASTSASTIVSCATTRPSRRSGWAAASVRTTPTRSSTTTTTTRSRRTWRFLASCVH